MSDRLDELERRIDELRAGVRRAMRMRDAATARALRAELRTAEKAWDALVSRPGGGQEDRPPRLVTVREQVHQALSLLGAPAQARMVVAVSGAFLAGTIRSSQLTSLRRDEERSFRSSPFGRPYYLCAALTDRLSPARGYLTVSTWPIRDRVVGPLSPRVDFLTCAIRIAEHTAAGGRSPEGDRLLARMARNIPGAGDGVPPDPERVAEAARRELAVHAERDARDREELAQRATAQLDDAARLFGAPALTTVTAPRPVTTATTAGMRGGR